MNKNIYISILKDTLRKKNDLLDEIIQITLQQSRIMDNNIDVKLFNKSIDDKAVFMERLYQLDDGFEKVYEHVKEELRTNRLMYKEDILELQELIRKITDKSVRLQAAELNNKTRLESFSVNKREEIKNFRNNRKTVANYYKSMPSQHQGQSYFFNKKK